MRSVRRPVTCALLAVLAGVGNAHAARPQPLPVSPGARASAPLISEPCPTFTWTAGTGAAGLELVVFRLLDTGAAAPEAMLRVHLPDSASGWTPSLEHCLEHGGRYAWLVGKAGSDGSTEWSPPNFFEVSAGPTEGELLEAVALVRRYMARQKQGVADSAATTTPAAEPTANEDAPRGGTKALGGSDFSVDGAGNVEAASFTGDGSGLTGISADDASDLACAGCVSESELDFDPATQAELDAKTHSGADITSGTVGEAFIDGTIARDAEIVPAVLAADGTGSGLDADLFDGNDSAAFVAAAGDAMSGDLDMDGNKILGVAELQNAGSLVLDAGGTNIELRDSTSIDGVIGVTLDDADNASSATVLDLAHATTGTAAAGIGTAIDLQIEDDAGNVEDAARIEALLTDAADGSEDSELRFYLRAGGAGIGAVASLDGSGRLDIGGDLTISGGAETLDNPGFSLDGDDLFVAGTAGVEGTIFTDSGVTVGASTTYADGAITQSTAGSALTLDVAGGDAAGEDLVVIADNLSVSAGGVVTAASFSGDGSALTGISADDASDLDCAGCVSAGELDFDPATQAELDAKTHSGADITSGAVGEAFIAGALARDTEVLPIVLAGDGVGSGLDADLFDGSDSADFVAAGGDAMTGDLDMDGNRVLNPGALDLPANGLTVGTSQLVVTGGKLGLGLTNPTGDLHVVGDGAQVYVEDSGSGTERHVAQLFMDDSTVRLVANHFDGGATPDMDMTFEVRDGGAPLTAMKLLGDGRVGIGTTTPGEELHVAGDVAVGGGTSTLSNGGFTLGGDDLFVAGTAGIEGTIFTDSGLTVGASTTYADGAITQSTGGASLTIDVAGGDAAGEDFIVTADNVSVSAGGTVTATEFVGGGGGLTGVSDSTRVAKAGDTMTGPLGLPTNGLAVGTSQLVVSGGNVGVGTATPSEPFHLSKSAGGTHLVAQIENTGSFSAAGLRLKTPAANSNFTLAAQEDGGGNARGLEVQHALGTLFHISATTGNVGIGTISPGEDLEVVGTVKATAFSGDGSALTGLGRVLVAQDEFDRELIDSYWTTAITGVGLVELMSSPSQVRINSGSGGAGSVNLTGIKSFTLASGGLVFRGKLGTYEDGSVYGDRQPRGLVNGTDRNEAIEFVSASPTSVTARTVTGGTATETTVSIGRSVYLLNFYQIVATSSQVQFYVNGELIATHTTNIPTAALNVYVGTDYSGGGQIPVDVDYLEFERVL